jgi:predicted nucleic acid-binding protein
VALLDSCFLIDALKGKPETNKLLKSGRQLYTSQINMYEVIKGLFLRNISGSKYLEALELFKNINVVSLDDDAIIKSAEISAELIKKGQEIQDADCITAGVALSKGINTIITRNAEHFRRIKGIKVETY